MTIVSYINEDFRIIRQDSLSIMIKINGDRTSWQWYFTVKKSPTDTDENAIIKKLPTDITSTYYASETVLNQGEPDEITIPADTTVIVIPLTSNDTNIPSGSYKYDVQFVYGSKIKTLMKGNFIVEYEITQGK